MYLLIYQFRNPFFIIYKPFMKQIEHIGIAVRDLDEAIPLYESLLGTTCYKKETVASEQVTTAFFKVGNQKVELLASTDPMGVIARFIDKKGAGIHHIAYAVEDIISEMKRLQAEGFTLLQEHPKEGADNKWVCFVHPKDTGGVLMELCQERN